MHTGALRHRRQHLDCLVGDLSEIDRHPLVLEPAGFDPGQQKQIVDELVEDPHVVLDARQIPCGVGGDSILERFDRCLQGGERGP